MIGRILAIAVLALLSAVKMLGGPAMAQTPQQPKCDVERLTPAEKLTWYNPKPSPTDFTLPMPGGLDLVFVPVFLSVKGLYGNEKSTYTMGSSTPRVFETKLDVRISSPITDKQRDKSVLLIGKYEMSNGQYAVIMGEGQIDAGIELLYLRSREQKLKDVLVPYVTENDPCHHKLTKEIIDVLARPVSFLSYRDYVEVIDRFNLYCIRQDACGRKLGSLSANRDYPAFVRLPTEHEWEFAARGGGEYAAGRLSRKDLQADLPNLPQGKTLSDFAHFGNDPAHLLAVGSREPLFGLYDMFGNADELMLNPFTAENGFGAVGGHVVRGGSYSLKASELRVSRRSELASLFWDDDRKVYDIQYFPKVGIRLMVGLPIWGTAERRGSNDVAETFESEYAPVSEAGDIAGNTSADAKDVGQLGPKGVRLGDEVGGADAKDIFAFGLGEYSDLGLIVRGKAVAFEIRDAENKVLPGKAGPSSKPGEQNVLFANVLPGRYELHVFKPSGDPSDEKYDFELVKTPVADTGVPTMTTAALSSTVTVSDIAGPNISGFVGQGDATDNYPLLIDSNKGGILIQVSSAKTALRVRYLDDAQKILGEAIVDTKTGEAKLPVPVSPRSKGFVQVVSESGTGTQYELKVIAEVLTDSQFDPKPVISRSILMGAPYRGYLNNYTRELYFGIQLAYPRTLRVELTRLEANVDLDIIGPNNTVVQSAHMRTGKEPEFFVASLDAGQYQGRLTLRETDKQTPFQIFATTSDYVPTGGAQDLQVARNQAQDLGSLTGSYNSASRYITGTGVAQYFRFRVLGVGMLMADVSGFTADADLDILIEDKQGNVLAKSSNTGDQSELVRIKTSYGGEFLLRVQPAGTSTRYSYALSLSYAEKAKDPDLSTYGPVVDRFVDWEVRKDSDGKCWMLTTAREMEPELGWRVDKPYFYIGVDPRGESVYMGLDYANPPESLYNVESIRGSLVGASGNFKLMFDRNWLKALTRENCKAGWCVNNNAVSAFVRGKALRVSAKSKDNADVSFVYSLSGYVKAARAINTLCKARIGWVYGR